MNKLRFHLSILAQKILTYPIIFFCWIYFAIVGLDTVRNKEFDAIDSDIIDSGLAKVRRLDEATSRQLFDYIIKAQEGDADAREKAREILLNDAKFTEEEFGMYAIFD